MYLYLYFGCICTKNCRINIVITQVFVFKRMRIVNIYISRLTKQRFSTLVQFSNKVEVATNRFTLAHVTWFNSLLTLETGDEIHSMWAQVRDNEQFYLLCC